jgi:hypothetical protein
VAINSGNVLQLGSPPSNQGIAFTAGATPPSGYTNSFVWVQLITGDTFGFTLSSGLTQTCTVNSLGLDNRYPYAPTTGNTVPDSPFVNLNSGDSKTTRTFSAQMYLLWSSGLTNSIPVPLGSASWSFFADAVQNMSTQQWTVQPDSSRSANAFQAGNSYPSWTSLYTNGGSTTCH